MAPDSARPRSACFSFNFFHLSRCSRAAATTVYRHRSSVSVPVIAVSVRVGLPEKRDTSAVHIEIPADGPSLGTDP